MARRAASSSLSLFRRRCRFVVVVVVFLSSAIDLKHSKPSTKSEVHNHEQYGLGLRGSRSLGIETGTSGMEPLSGLEAQ